MLLSPGTILGGRYEIVSKIGSGGMAVVYRGRDKKLERYVSVKVLREEFIGDDEFMGRFESEACSVAKLSHPNIVRVYDVGQEGDINYIVMEYIHGNTLKKAIKEKAPFDSNSTLNVAIQIASALSQAHQNQIIHRDIKPQNILVSTDGVAKVTDFGIARAATVSTMTTTANAAGSVHYFSPEQARGGYVDEKSDIYSLGITMYEMITGELPFQGSNSVSIALKHISEEVPDIRIFNPNCSHALEGIIKKAIMKKADERYSNIELMLADLVLARKDSDNEDDVSKAPHINMRPSNKNENIVDTAMSYLTSRRNRATPSRNELAEPLVKTPIRANRFQEDDKILNQVLNQETINKASADSGFIDKNNYIDNGDNENSQMRENKRNELNETNENNGAYRPKREKEEEVSSLSRNIVNEVKGNFDKYDKKLHISKGNTYEEEYVDLPPMENSMKRGRQTDMENQNNRPPNRPQNRPPNRPPNGQAARKQKQDLAKKKSKQRTIFAAILVSVFIIASICVGFLRMVNSGKFNIVEEQTVIAMPNLIGLALSDATEPAGDVGLTLEVIAEEVDAYYDKGVIIKQEITAGEDVITGTTIGITISKGLESFTMPNILDMEEKEAIELIETLVGATPSVTYQFSDKHEIGVVFEQTPSVGDGIDAKTNIRLVISRGEQNSNVYVPNVVGRTKDQATSDLTAVGLRVGSISEVESDSVDKGKVITQTIKSGTQVSPNSVVNLVVSLGNLSLDLDVGTNSGLDHDVYDDENLNNEDYYNYDDDEEQDENENEEQDEDEKEDEKEETADDLETDDSSDNNNQSNSSDNTNDSTSSDSNTNDSSSNSDSSSNNEEVLPNDAVSPDDGVDLPNNSDSTEVDPGEPDLPNDYITSQKSFLVNVSDTSSDSVVVQITCDDMDGYSTGVNEIRQTTDFPYTAVISGRGQGTVSCFIDGQLQWTQVVDFSN